MPPRMFPDQAADAPAPPSVPQPFIKEWVRFWFHGIAISVCGALAALLPNTVSGEVVLPVRHVLVALGAFALWVGCAVVIGRFFKPSRPWLDAKQLLGVSLLLAFTSVISVLASRQIPWPVSPELGLSYSAHQLSGWLLAGSLALFAWYELLRCRPRLKAFMRSWIFWPLTRWMVWTANRIKVRPHEIGTRSSSLDFLAGLGIIWVLCPLWVLASACFITAWADPFARVIGKRYGKVKWPFGSKTVEGSLTCFAIAAVISFTVLHWFYGPDARVIVCALFVGVATALAELIPQWPKEPRPGDMLSPADNFWLILSSGFALHGAQLWLTI